MVEPRYNTCRGQFPVYSVPGVYLNENGLLSLFNVYILGNLLSYITMFSYKLADIFHQQQVNESNQPGSL